MKEINQKIMNGIKNEREEEIKKTFLEKTIDLLVKNSTILNCPANNKSIGSIFCICCIYGHINECHYPKTCIQAQCSHYLKVKGNLEKEE